LQRQLAGECGGNQGDDSVDEASAPGSTRGDRGVQSIGCVRDHLAARIDVPRLHEFVRFDRSIVLPRFVRGGS